MSERSPKDTTILRNYARKYVQNPAFDVLTNYPPPDCLEILNSGHREANIVMWRLAQGCVWTCVTRAVGQLTRSQDQEQDAITTKELRVLCSTFKNIQASSGTTGPHNHNLVSSLEKNSLHLTPEGGRPFPATKSLFFSIFSGGFKKSRFCGRSFSERRACACACPRPHLLHGSLLVFYPANFFPRDLAQSSFAATCGHLWSYQLPHIVFQISGSLMLRGNSSWPTTRGLKLVERGRIGQNSSRKNSDSQSPGWS